MGACVCVCGDGGDRDYRRATRAWGFSCGHAWCTAGALVVAAARGLCVCNGGGGAGKRGAVCPSVSVHVWLSWSGGRMGTQPRRFAFPALCHRSTPLLPRIVSGICARNVPPRSPGAHTQKRTAHPSMTQDPSPGPVLGLAGPPQSTNPPPRPPSPLHQSTCTAVHRIDGDGWEETSWSSLCDI